MAPRRKPLLSALWRCQLAWAWEKGLDEKFGKSRGCRGQAGELGWLPGLGSACESANPASQGAGSTGPARLLFIFAGREGLWGQQVGGC